MSNQMKVVEGSLGLQFDVWRENVKSHVEQGDTIFPFSPDGRPVKKKSIDKDTLKIPVGEKKNIIRYIADEGGQGNVYAEPDIIWKDAEGNEVAKPSMTNLFTILVYKPLHVYLNNFILEGFQEIWAYDGETADKPEDRERMKAMNNIQMFKLVKKLHDEQVVAGGHFNASSNSTKPGMAFLRAIYEESAGKIHWGLELATFKNEKIFLKIQEELPKDPATIVVTGKRQAESRLLI